MSIEKLIAENTADARELWLKGLPDEINFIESGAKSDKKSSFLFGKSGKVLAAVCLCLAMSFVSIADEAPNHISISYDIYNDCYKISIESNFEKSMPWKQIIFGYLPDGYEQLDENISEYEKSFNFTETTDQPNSYTDKYYHITVLKLDNELRSSSMTHYTTWLLPKESRMDVNGNSSLVLSLGITTSIYMPKENYVVMISGTLPKDEMIRIVENISFVDDGQKLADEVEEDSDETINPVLTAYISSPVIRISLIYIAVCLAVYLALTIHERRKGGKK